MTSIEDQRCCDKSHYLILSIIENGFRTLFDNPNIFLRLRGAPTSCGRPLDGLSPHDADHDSVDVEGAKRLFREHLEEIVPFLEDMEKKMPAKV